MSLTKQILRLAYPVGSVYVNVSDSTNPATLLGFGTWERLSGRFLLGATDNGSSGASQAAGRTGGEASHALTEAEMAKHAHSYAQPSSNTGSTALNYTHLPERTMVTVPLKKQATLSYSQWTGGTLASGTWAATNLYDANSSGGWPTEYGKGHTHSQQTSTKDTGSKGSGTAHNNMPPYLSVYMWKRTA